MKYLIILTLFLSLLLLLYKCSNEDSRIKVLGMFSKILNNKEDRRCVNNLKEYGGYGRRGDLYSWEYCRWLRERDK